jgi:S1-C subfamily serine protease
MRIKLILLLSVLFSCSLFGQNKLYYDVEWRATSAQNATYYRVYTNNIADTVKDYYTTGEIESKGIALVLDTVDDVGSVWKGIKTSYYRDGTLMAVDCFNSLGKRDSISRHYYETGKLKQELNYKNGFAVGKYYKEWDEFGNLEKVFNETFHEDNNVNSWPLSTNEKHSCKILVDTGLQMATYGEIGVAQAISLPLDINRDFSIDAVVSFKAGDDAYWHGIIWGFKDWSNYLYYYISADGHYKIGHFQNGIENVQSSGQTSNYIKKSQDDINQQAAGQTSDALHEGKDVNDMQVIRKKGNMIYSVNGLVLEELKSYLLYGNYIGFSIPEGKQRVIFKKLMVRQSLDTGKAGNSSGSGIKVGQNSSNNEFSGWKGNGSGFFIDPSGYIVTNNHVVENATEVEVDAIQDGQRVFFKAKVISTDKTNDLAVLKITDDKFKAYTTLPYNFKTETSDVAESIFALGFPEANRLGVEVKFTDGKISAKTGYKGNPEWYQISVPVQPGNSGGPLFDYNGNIIGIVNAKIVGSAESNVAYAIKSSYLKTFLETLPAKLNLPSSSSLAQKPLTDKIKVLTDYVVMIKVK